MTATDLIKFEGGRDQAFDFLDPNSENLGEGIGASYGIVGYKGKNWSLRYRGETYYFIRQDDGTPLALLNVIIISQAHTKSKSYFPTWEDGSADPPVCWSMDTVTPDADVPADQKQSTACSICPRNAFYVNNDGKKKRDCSDYKRIAVLLPVDHTARMLGSPLVEAAFLRVPAASLQALGMLGEQLQKKGLHFAEVITQIAFDPKESYPKMIFTAIARAPGQFAEKIKELREDMTTQRIVGTVPQLGRGPNLVQIPQGAQHPNAEAPAQPRPQLKQPGDMAVETVRHHRPEPLGFATGPQTLDLKATPSPEAAALAAKLAADREARIAAIRAEEHAASAPAPAPATGSGAVPQTASPTPVAPTLQMQPASQAPAAAPANSQTPPPATPQQPADGFSGVAVAATPTAQSATPAPPPADTGTATETDAEMDARIAALMPR